VVHRLHAEHRKLVAAVQDKRPFSCHPVLHELTSPQSWPEPDRWKSILQEERNLNSRGARLTLAHRAGLILYREAKRRVPRHRARIPFPTRRERRTGSLTLVHCWVMIRIKSLRARGWQKDREVGHGHSSD
jgi:hypothetical protein